LRGALHLNSTQHLNITPQLNTNLQAQNFRTAKALALSSHVARIVDTTSPLPVTADMQLIITTAPRRPLRKYVDKFQGMDREDTVEQLDTHQETATALLNDAQGPLAITIPKEGSTKSKSVQAAQSKLRDLNIVASALPSSPRAFTNSVPILSERTSGSQDFPKSDNHHNAFSDSAQNAASGKQESRPKSDKASSATKAFLPSLSSVPSFSSFSSSSSSHKSNAREDQEAAGPAVAGERPSLSLELELVPSAEDDDNDGGAKDTGYLRTLINTTEDESMQVEGWHDTDAKRTANDRAKVPSSAFPSSKAYPVSPHAAEEFLAREAQFCSSGLHPESDVTLKSLLSVASDGQEMSLRRAANISVNTLHIEVDSGVVRSPKSPRSPRKRANLSRYVVVPTLEDGNFHNGCESNYLCASVTKSPLVSFPPTQTPATENPGAAASYANNLANNAEGTQRRERRRPIPATGDPRVLLHTFDVLSVSLTPHATAAAGSKSVASPLPSSFPALPPPFSTARKVR
jgi:hypothetical protein